MRPVALALALLLAACADAPADAPATPEPAPEATPPEAERPATDTATITVEGEPMELAVRLVRFDDIALPFSTTLPEDWASDWTASGEGEAVVFTMGEPPLQGVVQLFIPSEANRVGLADMARSVAESRGEVSPLEHPGPWATDGLAFSGNGEVGSVRVGSHAGVPFYVVEAYPAEMGDGFGPRAALVLERLRWADDGTGL